MARIKSPVFCVRFFYLFNFILHNNTLFHIYTQRKNYKNCRKLETKVAKEFCVRCGKGKKFKQVIALYQLGDLG